jgi:sulfatase maturation enzyme AslB (radical SAM superfamily)
METKKVTLKLGELDGAQLGLKRLVNEKLPFKASYWLRRNIDNISKVYQPFFEAKQLLFKDYAILENGNPKINAAGMVELIPEKLEEFWGKYRELAMEEVEIEIFPIKLELFEKVESSVNELDAISFMIEE